VFNAPAIRGGETMVVSPHPDDSEIAAFGWYSQYPSWVVTVTAGERSPTDLSNVVPVREEKAHWLASLRVWDSLQIPGLGGVPRARRLSLVFPDGRLKMMHESPTRSYKLACEDSLPRQVLRSRNPLTRLQSATPDCTWGSLVGEIQWLLETVRPSTVMCPHPLVDPSPDHVFTTLAIAEALRNSTHQPDVFLLYVVHVNEVPIYPFGGAESAVSLPPWRQGGWLADTIYSHALTEDARHAKFFAVEASHDLRTYPDLRSRSIGQLMTAIRRELAAFVSGMGLRPTDFLRRAPRPNELYYVVSARGFLDLAERALHVQTITNAR
jgi:LmbE family N-acetylglucosaminyl deacetylase